VSDQAVVIAVAGYPTRRAARRDFQAVCGFDHDERAHLAAAVVEKGADGQLAIERHKPLERIASGTALLGGALVVVAAPLGIKYLVSVLGTKVAWAGVGAVVAQFWNNVPKADLRRMTDLLEATQAALVVVALEQERGVITPLLTNASTSVVSATTVAVPESV
jgi:hypothetical protein